MTRYGALPEWIRDHVAHVGEECLLWPFGKLKSGYGSLLVAGKRTTAHRLMCRLTHGEPASELLDAAHSCGNRGCCNPNHLRWATRTENTADKLVHGTHGRGENNYKASITEAQAREIISQLGRKKPSLIAAELGVSRAVVKSISAGCSWSWLSGFAPAPSLKKRGVTVSVRAA